MELHFNNKGDLDYIDCDTKEFIEIQTAFNNIISLDMIPKKLGKTTRERIHRYLDLRRKGYIII